MVPVNQDSYPPCDAIDQVGHAGLGSLAPVGTAHGEGDIR
jgi:hypothetical protein